MFFSNVRQRALAIVYTVAFYFFGDNLFLLARFVFSWSISMARGR